MMKRTGISQQQIARDLGVSQTLVSMVLNGRRKGVSEKSYEKIWNHARKMGYRPKGINTELMAESPMAKPVGFLLRNGATLYDQNPFFGHVQHGLHAYLSEQGISLIYLGNENEFDVQNLENLENPDRFLGLVVLGEVSRPFLQAICKLNSRVVTISCQYSGLCNSVLPNEEQSAELLVQHLMELGHKSFAWIGGDRDTQCANNRLQSIRGVLHKFGASLDERFCIESELSQRMDGNRAAEALLEAAGNDPLPTAWISFNGVMARGAINLLANKGLAVPRDISIAAIDGTRVCEDEHPTLTSAATHPGLMGREAAQLLVQFVDKDKGSFSDLMLSTELVNRESTGQAPLS